VCPAGRIHKKSRFCKRLFYLPEGKKDQCAAEAAVEAASITAEAASVAAEAASVAAEAASVAATAAESAAAEATSAIEAAASAAAAASSFLPQAARAMAAINEANRSDFFMLISSKGSFKKLEIRGACKATITANAATMTFGCGASENRSASFRPQL
jgi:hypothetical protein